MKLFSRLDILTKSVSIIIVIFLLVISFGVLLADRFGILSSLFSINKPKVDNVRTIIDMDTIWDYLDTGNEPGVGNVWATSEYNSKAWKKSNGFFVTKNSSEVMKNYDSSYKTYINELDKIEKNISTYFFRHEFTIENIEDVNAIKGSINFRDAAIIYLNGQAIFTANIPPNGYKSNIETGAAENYDQFQNRNFEVTNLDSLKEGKNIIAVEIHKKDNESSKAFFCLDKMDLYKLKQNEKPIEVSSVFLEQGETDRDIRVNWISESRDSYKIEYMDASYYSGKESDFAKYGKTVLLGRKSLDKSSSFGKYLGNIERLKYNTDYIYRMAKVGGSEPSKLYTFSTSDRKQFSFSYLYKVDLLESTLSTMAYDFIDKSDFLVYSMTNKKSYTNDMAIKNIYDFYKPIEFKEQPSIFLFQNNEDNKIAEIESNSKFDRQNQDELGNYYIAFKDSLVFSINKISPSFNSQKVFINEAVKNRNRKWNMVFLDISYLSSEFTVSENNIKSFIDELDKMGLDIVVIQDELGLLDEKIVNIRETKFLYFSKDSPSSLYNVEVDITTLMVKKINMTTSDEELVFTIKK